MYFRIFFNSNESSVLFHAHGKTFWNAGRLYFSCHSEKLFECLTTKMVISKKANQTDKVSVIWKDLLEVSQDLWPQTPVFWPWTWAYWFMTRSCSSGHPTGALGIKRHLWACWASLRLSIMPLQPRSALPFLAPSHFTASHWSFKPAIWDSSLGRLGVPPYGPSNNKGLFLNKTSGHCSHRMNSSMSCLPLSKESPEKPEKFDSLWEASGKKQKKD